MDPRSNDEFARLDGKTALVTGSSSGIGRAIALELARAGAHVIVHAARRQEAALCVAKQIESLGRSAKVILFDYLDKNQRFAQFADEAWNWRTGLDILVNNAGVDVLTDDAASWSFQEKLAALWGVDVLGTIELSRHLGRLMKQAPNGAIILNMGWDQADHGMAGDSGEMFAAAKGAIMAFSRSLARSLSPEVRVHCLAPGWIKTAWGETASEHWQIRATTESLLQRWGTPEDVARWARFLASSAAAFSTGEVFRINGGWQSSISP